MIQMTILILFSITGERIELRPKFIQEPSIYEELSKSLKQIKTITIEAKERKRMGFRTDIENQKIAGKWEEIQVKIDEIIELIEKEKKKMERIGSGKGVRRAEEAIKRIEDGKKRMEKLITRGDFKSLEEEIKKAMGPPREPVYQYPYEYKERTERIEPFKGFEGLRRSEPTPEDTMSTPGAEITAEIIKKAQELGDNPINIFNYVKNEIHYVPYYGSMKGSQGALYEVSGNDCDQAGLLIALLRSLGIPARFVRGIIHLSVERAIKQFGGNDANDVMTILTTSGIPYSVEVEDGEVKDFKIEWFWVTTYIPYQRYGGSREDGKGKVWIELFPSLEKKDIEPGLNIPGFMDFDAVDFLRNYYKEIHSSPLEVYRNMILDTLNAHFPDKEYKDALMEIERETEEFLILPLSKPVEVEIVTGEYVELPVEIRWRLSINIKDFITSQSILSSIVLSATIFSRNFSVIWVPATGEDSSIVESYGGFYNTLPYLFDVKPVLRSNGKALNIGGKTGAGRCSYLTVNIIEPDRASEYKFYAKSGIDCSLFFIQLPTDLFFSNPPENEGITSREEKLYNTGIKWGIMERNNFSEASVSMNLMCRYIYTIGGVYSNAPFFEYYLPLNSSWVGLIISIPGNWVDIYDPYSTGKKKDCWFLHSLQGSYLENKVFEDYFGVEAISATKSIMVAESLGIPVYSITKGGAEPFIIPDVGGTSRSREFKMGKPLTKLDFPEESINQVIVKIKKGYKVEEIIKDGKIIDRDGRRGYLVEVSDVRAAIDKLKREKGVEYVEENGYYFATDTKRIEGMSLRGAKRRSNLKSNPKGFFNSRGTAPNDPLFPEQWSMRRILAPSVWDSTTGDTNIVIGLLDTGIDTGNVEFSGRIKNGYDFVNDDSIPFDDNGHGTMMAGIIGAEGNNNTGIAGIGWNLSLLPVKVLNAEGMGSNWDIGQGIMFACDSDARVINMSLGGYESSSYIQDAVDYAYNMGCVLVSAAGNDNTSLVFYPAAYDNVAGVSATDRNDIKAEFSNFGSYVFCSAPGVGIYTTMLDNEYGLVSGTSASSAVVSGMVGLLLSREPGLSPSEVMQRLQDYSDDIGIPGWDDCFGYGRINGFKLLFGD
ncbi:S8 family serine peptidase, partial [candidate division WOR-3 bacterium]|nr:S8 family serine peptidase [candidate division WOR-3 bacterium]